MVQSFNPITPAQGIEIRHAPDRIELLLPYRQLRELRKVGLPLMIAGLCGIGFMGFWMSGPLLEGVRLLAKGQWQGLFLVLFASTGLIGLALACGALSTGWALLRSRTRGRIVIDDYEIVYREVLGWITKKMGRLPLAELQQLQISCLSELELMGRAKIESQPTDIPGLKNWFALVMVPATADHGSEPDRRTRFLAIGYPEEQLREFVPVIIEQLAAANKKFGISIPLLERPVTQRVAVMSSDSSRGKTNSRAKAALKEAPQKPSGCSVEIIRDPGRPTIFKMPPLGFTGHTRQMLTFSIMFTGISLVVAGVATGVFLQQKNDWGTVAFVASILTLFLLIGVSLLVYTVSLARRVTIIGIDQDLLFFETKGLFRTTWVDIDRHDIDSVVVEPSGTTINGVPLRQLRIVRKSQTDQDVVMFTGRDDAELAWIGYELNRELGLSAGDLAIEPEPIAADSDPNAWT